MNAKTASPPADTVDTGFQSAFLSPRYWPVWLALGLLRLSGLLPARLRAAVGSLFGDLYYWSSAKRRRIAEINLSLCFPHWSTKQRDHVARAHFRIMTQALTDYGWLWWATPKQLEQRVRVVGLEHYQAARDQGHNVILLAPHFVALDAGGKFISHRGYGSVSMFKATRDPLVNWIVARSRLQFGARLFARGDNLRPLVKVVRQGAGFYYLPDEDLGPKECVFAPFFGIPAATLPTLGRLAQMCDAVVVPCFTRMLPKGQGYEVRFRPALADFPTGDPVADATRMNQEIEQGVLDMPEQYLWVYKRFKSRPGGATSPYDAPRD
jgi:KDO2-lipid IV(A) lauroyltransferase